MVDGAYAFEVIKKALEEFYLRRITKLMGSDIFDIIKRKNPYLYRAFGTANAHDYIKALLADTQTSSDETLFGEFFETVAIAVSGGRKSSANSIDLEIWSPDQKSVKLIAVKSGPHIFNAQSKQRQNVAFQEAMKRLTKVAVTPIVGYSYGRKENRGGNQNNFSEVAGQAFWEEITGDSGFYIKLMDYIGQAASQHKEKFDEEWNKCINRLFKAFLDVFGNEDGSIDWESVVIYNSQKESPLDINEKIRAVKKNLKSE